MSSQHELENGRTCRSSGVPSPSQPFWLAETGRLPSGSSLCISSFIATASALSPLELQSTSLQIDLPPGTRNQHIYLYIYISSHKTPRLVLDVPDDDTRVVPVTLDQPRDLVELSVQAVETQGKGSVLAMEAVETQGKGSVIGNTRQRQCRTCPLRWFSSQLTYPSSSIASSRAGVGGL